MLRSLVVLSRREKTKLLIIGTNEQKRNINEDEIEIKVCDKSVKVSPSEKLLGLVVNGKLTWKEYLYGETWRTKKVDNFKGIIPKLSQRIGLLKQLRTKMGNESFNLIVNGLFTSVVRYCIHVFGNVWITAEDNDRRYRAFTKKDNNKLQVLQNQVFKMKLNLPASSNISCKDLVRMTGDMSIHQLTAYFTLLQVHKTVSTKKLAT